MKNCYIFWQCTLALIALLAGTTCLMAAPIMRMATTTSTENSGLLTALNPAFEKQYNVRLDVIAVGTGKALRLGANGDVDLVLVHAPKAEQSFVKAGHGLKRIPVMHNDFVLIGPASDPAQIRSSRNAADALRQIAAWRAEFISRGDDSGTHKKELELWQQARITPETPWYVSAGQGMGAVLTMAHEKQAYTLTDRGTYLAYPNKPGLPILFQADPVLHNPYHVIAVNPDKHTSIQYDLARKYIDYITGPQGQTIIKTFKMAGQVLFYPDALP